MCVTTTIVAPPEPYKVAGSTYHSPLALNSRTKDFDDRESTGDLFIFEGKSQIGGPCQCIAHTRRSRSLNLPGGFSHTNYEIVGRRSRNRVRHTLFPHRPDRADQLCLGR